jgi:hypothetical protein
LSSPVSWSSNLHIALSGLHVEAELVQPDDGEPVDLAQSMAASILQEEAMPGDFNAPVPEMEQDQSLIVSLIERLTARLSLEIQDAVLLLHAGPSTARLELQRISLSAEDLSRSRRLNVTDLLVRLRAPAATPSAASTNSDTSFGSADEMAMSMAIADLRQSTMQESVYHSIHQDLPRQRVEWPLILRAPSLALDVKLASAGWRMEDVALDLAKVEAALWPEQLGQLKEALEAWPSSPASQPSKAPQTLNLRLRVVGLGLAVVYDTSACSEWSDASSIPASSHLRVSNAQLECGDETNARIADLRITEVSPRGLKTNLLRFVEAPDIGAEESREGALQDAISNQAGLSIKIAGQKASLQIRPMALFAHLDLMERLQPLLDYLARLAEPAPPQPRETATGLEWTSSCDFIRASVQCPSRDREEALLEVDLWRLELSKRAAALQIRLDSLALAYASGGEPVSTSNEAFDPRSSETRQTLSAHGGPYTLIFQRIQRYRSDTHRHPAHRKGNCGSRPADASRPTVLRRRSDSAGSWVFVCSEQPKARPLDARSKRGQRVESDQLWLLARPQWAA